ncbi:MAG: Membrane protein insertase, YidC/Oxa1 family [Parcubacteria group bacterium GW2011_GWF2_44_8b]|nr:MAG: Membrane protein insertase, YidC/Oxa1 family [Parcubacteria group bacterium GW2011_GWC1_43_30]KKT80613.1 MAG: Membrane protein insertase, YidC/Oxa1 family [Parcubacteria group bacterium GW2011_GWF2_44_8b]KKT85067.1 MAG: Membrane protein insertase, YidC/Oxa1 family [Parcubacteria group bacterium GW2011_GWD1_44_9]
MSFLYHTFFFDPLYNVLILLFKLLPWADAGIIVILLTILVRLIMFPLSRKAVLTQVRMAEIAPDLAKIKEQYKDKAEDQAKLTLALYREKGVNPFSGILVIIIQIPIIFALYQIFLYFPEVKSSLLYSFVTAPGHINTTFLGFLDITAKSAPIALLAAISTFFQFQISMKGQTPPKGNSFGDNLTRSMQTQMKYFFPVIVFFISYKISGVIALYWLTTNLFTIGQELFVRRNLKANQTKKLPI